MADFGALEFNPEAIPYSATFGMTSRRRGSLADFIDKFDFAPVANAGREAEERYVPYVFNLNVTTEVAKRLMAAAELPGMPDAMNVSFQPGTDLGFEPQPPQFYIGAAGSGAPQHFHGDAWNALAHGLKQWWLFPPAAAGYSTIPVAEWAQLVLPGLQDRCGAPNTTIAPPGCPVVVMQRPGDIIFVPRDWGHAVLNLQASVGVAVEFES